MPDVVSRRRTFLLHLGGWLPACGHLQNPLPPPPPLAWFLFGTTHPREITSDLAWHKFRLKFFSWDNPSTHLNWEQQIWLEINLDRIFFPTHLPKHPPTQNEITPDLAWWKFGLKNLLGTIHPPPKTLKNHKCKLMRCDTMLISILVLLCQLSSIGPNFWFFFQIEIEAIFQVNPELLPSKSVLAAQVSTCKLFSVSKGLYVYFTYNMVNKNTL